MENAGKVWRGRWLLQTFPNGVSYLAISQYKVASL
jgi:hypothetical protein